MASSKVSVDTTFSLEFEDVPAIKNEPSDVSSFGDNDIDHEDKKWFQNPTANSQDYHLQMQEIQSLRKENDILKAKVNTIPELQQEIEALKKKVQSLQTIKSENLAITAQIRSENIKLKDEVAKLMIKSENEEFILKHIKRSRTDTDPDEDKVTKKPKWKTNPDLKPKTERLRPAKIIKLPMKRTKLKRDDDVEIIGWSTKATKIGQKSTKEKDKILIGFSNQRILTSSKRSLN